MKKIKQNQGVTMVEMLIVVAIMAALAGVSFVGISSRLRSMTKLEYDGYAKEIFVAAQNHLTMAEHEGYLGLTDYDFGTAEANNTVPADNTAGLSPTKAGVYYIVVKSGSVYTPDGGHSGQKALALMLPEGALADGKTLSGSYIIRYHKESARILDVFFWEENATGWGGRFNHTYQDDSDYKGFLDAVPDGLKDYSGSVIGYYGGATAGLTYKNDVLAPSCKIENGDVLRVIVTDSNTISDVVIELRVTGKSSGAVKTFNLLSGTVEPRISGTGSSSNPFIVVLDDITNKDLHFANLGSDPSKPSFIPGENLKIEAYAYVNDSGDTVHNVAVSGSQSTNSLFDSISKNGTGIFDFDTAYIKNIRHLENLDNTISNVSYASTSKVAITNAIQQTDLDFTQFKPKGAAAYTITRYDGTATNINANSFLPMNPGYTLTYNGGNFGISNVTVGFTTGHSTEAGLFGAPTSAINVKDLKLIDFTVSGTKAGALAGTLVGGSTVTNVIVYNSKGRDSSFNSTRPNITGITSAGGLIGENKGTVTACAAAVYVKGDTSGGLIGTMSDGSVTASYSGGHTTGGMYVINNYNVSGTTTAGGFIGSMTKGAVNYCYSTCSASATNGTVGGFVGSVTTGSSISNSYCTGLVDGTTKGAFAGNCQITPANCHYFSIINGDLKSGGTEEITGVTAFDGETLDANGHVTNTATQNYRSFASGNANAVPYDPTLMAYYKGKYNLKSVKDLGATLENTSLNSNYDSWTKLFVSTHYGDWPAPEIFFVNTPTT